MERTAIRDVRLALAGNLEEAALAAAPAPRCVVCDRRLPNGLQRSHCLEHSRYAQELIQNERRRRTRRRLRATHAA